MFGFLTTVSEDRLLLHPRTCVSLDHKTRIFDDSFGEWTVLAPEDFFFLDQRNPIFDDSFGESTALAPELLFLGEHRIPTSDDQDMAKRLLLHPKTFFCAPHEAAFWRQASAN